MPTIRTIISDLYRNRSRGVGGTAAMGAVAALQTSSLSNFFRVTQNATPITVGFGAAPNEVVTMAHAPINTANGFHLFFEDGWSTVATLTRAHRIVLGGGYSGCLYSVYNAGAGVFKCVHTARPAGADSDTFVQGLQGYAQSQGWVLVHAIPTTGGLAVAGCVTTFLATRVSYTAVPTPVVRTVRLRLNAQGLSVGRDRWEDPS